jgi:phosphoribosylaminoimidazolecarboxamide formyltransferase / IMP cyclohydrolase
MPKGIEITWIRQDGARSPTMEYSIVPTRYGENPHQPGGVIPMRIDGKEVFKVLRNPEKKELSNTNWLDLVEAISTVEEVARNKELLASLGETRTVACTIKKHTVSAALSLGQTAADAYERSVVTCDEPAFGSVIAFNAELSANLLDVVRAAKKMTEVVVTVGAEPGVLEALPESNRLRVVDAEVWWQHREAILEGMSLMLRPGVGLVSGFDHQTWAQEDPETHQKVDPLRPWKIITPKHLPTDALMRDWVIAWIACGRGAFSNSVAFAKDGKTLAVAAGGTQRSITVRTAAMIAEHNHQDLKGSASATDGFFPFRDGMDETVKTGASASLSPGGSVKDAEVIEAANEGGIAAGFAFRQRHFRHY